MKMFGRLLLLFAIAYSIFAFAQPPKHRIGFGHRLGGDVFPELPGNSMQAYRALLASADMLRKTKDIEFDVRELKTGELIVYHDSTFKHGLTRFFGKHVRDSTYQDIDGRCLKKSPVGKCYKIPRVGDVLEESKRLGVKKRLLIEVKNITEGGKNRLIGLIKQYRDYLNIGIIANRKNFKRLFSRRWCDEFAGEGLAIMQVYKRLDPKTNNLCDKYSINQRR